MPIRRSLLFDITEYLTDLTVAVNMSSFETILESLLYDMSLVMRAPVFEVSDQVGPKSAYSATEAS